jgi:hypothetical protein
MRIAVALIICLLTLTGCGDKDTGANPAPSSAQDRALAFSRCMRDNGVPNFPDPTVNEEGGVGLTVPDGTDRATVDRAMEACRQYQPDGGEPTKLDPQRLEQLRAYAKCMRENGIENLPDPTDQGIQVDGNTSGIDPASAAYQAADKVCRKHAPPEPGERPGLNTGG